MFCGKRLCGFPPNEWLQGVKGLLASADLSLRQPEFGLLTQVPGDYSSGFVGFSGDSFGASVLAALRGRLFFAVAAAFLGADLGLAVSSGCFSSVSRSCCCKFSNPSLGHSLNG